MKRIALLLVIGGALMGGVLVNLLAVLSEAEAVGLAGSMPAAILGAVIMPSVYLLSTSPEEETIEGRRLKLLWRPFVALGFREALEAVQPVCSALALDNLGCVRSA